MNVIKYELLKQNSDDNHARSTPHSVDKQSHSSDGFLKSKEVDHLKAEISSKRTRSRQASSIHNSRKDAINNNIEN